MDINKLLENTSKSTINDSYSLTHKRERANEIMFIDSVPMFVHFHPEYYCCLLVLLV